MPELTAIQWTLALAGALGIGLSKSGFSGVSMVYILIFAVLFGARDSTGIVLPMLIAGDICAVAAFRRHARWDYIRRMLPPAVIGVVCGWLVMQRLGDASYRPLIGWIIIILAALQLLRMRRPEWFAHIPHAHWFAWTLGLLAGLTTMLANGAGPIMALYFMAVGLPKFELVGTSAWFFLVINLLKVPFSAGLGLIHQSTLLLNLALIPAVAAGLLIGRWLVKRIPQRLFDSLLLAFAAIAALRLIGVL